MSAQVKQIWEMLIKSMALILVGVLSYVCYTALDKLEKTHEFVIRVEERQISDRKSIENIEHRVGTLEAKIK